MRLLDFEHGRTAYIADYLIYACAVIVLTGFLIVGQSTGRLTENISLALAGLAIWTLAEYGLHRYVLHGIQPFKNWHLEHHSRPKALIGSPTILSAGLILTLVFLPVYLFKGPPEASALTLGVMAGYLSYSVTHHAVHHWRAESAWLKQRRRMHMLHHHSKHYPGLYGVTTQFWDRMLGSGGRTGKNTPQRAELNGEIMSNREGR